MKRWTPYYAAWFIGVACAGAAGWWLWSHYGAPEDEPFANVTAVTRNGDGRNIVSMFQERA